MTSHSKIALRFANSGTGMFVAFVRNVAIWARRAQDRRALAQLDDHILSDIGLDRHAAERQAARRFWQD